VKDVDEVDKATGKSEALYTFVSLPKVAPEKHKSGNLKVDKT